MIADGVYYIFANHAGEFSYLTLDVPGGRLDDNVLIQQYGWHGGRNQQWQFTAVDDDTFTIVSVATTKALDVPNGLPIPGCPIQQFHFHGGPNQRWTVQTSPSVNGPEVFRPEYHRIHNVASQLALDVPNGSLAWRQTVQQWTPNNGWNQTWLLRPKQ